MKSLLLVSSGVFGCSYIDGGECQDKVIISKMDFSVDGSTDKNQLCNVIIDGKSGVGTQGNG